MENSCFPHDDTLVYASYFKDKIFLRLEPYNLLCKNQENDRDMTDNYREWNMQDPILNELKERIF
jgi:hypothetical protein